MPTKGGHKSDAGWDATVSKLVKQLEDGEEDKLTTTLSPMDSPTRSPSALSKFLHSLSAQSLSRPKAFQPSAIKSSQVRMGRRTGTNKFRPGGYDIEQLEKMIFEFKKRCTELELTNLRLKSRVQHHEAKLKLKEKEMENAVIIGGNDISSHHVAILKEKNRANMLGRKVRELSLKLGLQSEELEAINHSVKFSQVKEMQQMTQEFYAEVQRLRKFNELGREADNHSSLTTLEELKTLRHEVKRMQAENGDLNSKLMEVELQNEHQHQIMRKTFQKQIRILEEKLNRKTKRLNAIEQVTSVSKVQLHALLASSEGTKKLFENYESEIAMLKAELRAGEIELEETKTTMETMNAVNKQEMDAIVTGNTGTIKKLTAELESLQAERRLAIEKSKISMDQLDLEKEKLRAEIGLLEAKVHQRDHEIGSLTSIREAAEKNVIDMTASTSHEIANLRMENEKLKDDVTSLNDVMKLNLTKHEADMLSAESALLDAQKQMTEARNKVDDLTAELQAALSKSPTVEVKSVVKPVVTTNSSEQNTQLNASSTNDATVAKTASERIADDARSTSTPNPKERTPSSIKTPPSKAVNEKRRSSKEGSPRPSKHSAESSPRSVRKQNRQSKPDEKKSSADTKPERKKSKKDKDESDANKGKRSTHSDKEKKKKK